VHRNKHACSGQWQAKKHLRARMQWLAAGVGLFACQHAEGQRSRMQGVKWPVLASKHAGGERPGIRAAAYACIRARAGFSYSRSASINC
jgi:hypothetical protein